MSERGSFCTEYIYCEKCLEVAKKHLLAQGKFLNSIQIPNLWHPNGAKNPMPIIAGKVGGSCAGVEFRSIELTASDMAAELCHPVRIAVLSDSGGERFMTVEPIKEGPRIGRNDA